MGTLERAVSIAAEAHAGQHDKAGEPYLLHPLRLMLQVQTHAERVRKYERAMSMLEAQSADGSGTEPTGE